jgi:RNA polymerase sigma factor (sigma-70 family)
MWVMATLDAGDGGHDSRVQGDAELVAAARDGDRGAFSDLVQRHGPLAFALASELLGNQHVAADVVQEAAVTALVGLTGLRTPAKFGPWLCGIALNLARRWWRDARRDRLESAEWPPAPDDPEELALRADLAARVRAAVDLLPPGQRDAVLAFYWKGLTHAETAAELGVTIGAVKSRLHQARAALAPSLVSHATAHPCAHETTRQPVPERKEMPMPSSSPPQTSIQWIAVDVEEVRRSRDDEASLDFHAVVLREHAGHRRVPIYVGAAEATTLAYSIETIDTPRPMTYAMTSALVEAAGAQVTDVRITRLSEGTVYAVVSVEGAAGRHDVDARPSDALNLALVKRVPILVEADVFESLGSCVLRDWESYPTGTRDIVSEAQDRQARLMAAAAASFERQEDGPGES